MSWMPRIALAAALVAPSLGAQRPVRQPPRPTPAPIIDSTGRRTTQRAADTTTKRKTPDGFVLDFQEQDIRVVLSAIAEAGGLNVTLANLPSKRVTLRMAQPTTREAALDILRGVAEANSLKLIESPSLIRVEGTPQTTPQQSFQQAFAQQQQQQQLRLFTYRLRHASAVQLAPVLMNLFGGVSSGRGGQTFVPNANGGFQVFGNNAAVPGGNANIQVRPDIGAAGRAGQQAPNVQVNPNAGRGAAIAGLQQALTQAFAGTALSSAAADIRIVAEETTNSLLVRSTADDYLLIQQVLQAVDLRPLQVLIEVTIAEVQRTHDLNVGLSGSAARKTSGTSDTLRFASAASARDFVLQLTGGKGTIDYNVALNALQTRGDVRVLALPVIIAQNNRQAVLDVGSRVPFVQISQTVPNDPTGRVQTVQYQDVGTILTITPTINQDGYINLQVDQQDNSVTTQIQFDAPIINKRQATTQIFIRDGQTTVIGGLAGKTSTRTTSGIPFLSRIPLIGGLLFGNTQRNEATNELFLFLTPHIISSDEDIDRLRDAVHEGSDLLKQVPVGPRFVPVPADTIRVPRDLQPRIDSTRARPDSVRRRPTGVRTPVDSTPVRRPRPDSTPPVRRPQAPPDSTPGRGDRPALPNDSAISERRRQ
jgi:type II secretory pathway component GspD/PulD (secretin)